MQLKSAMIRSKRLITYVTVLLISLFMSVLGLSLIFIFLSSYPSQFFRILKLAKGPIFILYLLIPVIAITLVFIANKFVKVILFNLFKIEIKYINQWIVESDSEETRQLRTLWAHSRKGRYRAVQNFISSQLYLFLLGYSFVCTTANRGFYQLNINNYEFSTPIFLVAAFS
jgi:hypothetical protein